MKQAYEFKVGDRGLCSDGETKYEVIYELKRGEFVVVKTNVNGGERVCFCNKYGHDLSYGHSTNYLTPPTKQVDFWINVYHVFPGGVMQFQNLFPTKEEADKGSCGEKRLACLHIVREYEEGEGL